MSYVIEAKSEKGKEIMEEVLRDMNITKYGDTVFIDTNRGMLGFADLDVHYPQLVAFENCIEETKFLIKKIDKVLAEKRTKIKVKERDNRTLYII
jgi:hypothetical protein